MCLVGQVPGWVRQAGVWMEKLTPRTNVMAWRGRQEGDGEGRGPYLEQVRWSKMTD